MSIVYKTLNDIPEYDKPIIKRMIDSGVLDENDGIINITADMLRIFVVLARLGII